MKLEEIVRWLDATLKCESFDDVSNNGLQIERSSSAGVGVTSVAFAVDASVRAIEAASRAGAQLLVVHHGISWGGGVRRLTDGVYNVVKAAMDANLALYAAHLPLDAHPTLGNNAQLAGLFGLKNVRPAFNYHGSVIGVVGECLKSRMSDCLKRFGADPCFSDIRMPKRANARTVLLGLCSGGAGAFAEEAKRLGCDLYVTGEANWGERIAAENVGMKMVCLGHYETEVFGVRALSVALEKSLKIKTVDLTAAGSGNRMTGKVVK